MSEILTKLVNGNQLWCYFEFNCTTTFVRWSPNEDKFAVASDACVIAIWIDP
jgi:hypothetical protein